MAKTGVRGRPTAPLVLSAQERAYLERQVRRHRIARSLSERCRVILRCADGIASKDVAIELGVHEHTVGKWRRRFLKDRCDGLLDEARPGRPRSIGDDQVAAVIERTLRTTPADATHWSIVRWLRKLAFPTPRSAECGRLSACSRTVARRSSFQAIRCSSTRSVISSGFTSPRPTELSSSALMRRARSRHSIANSRFYR